jgi:GNAT superfamily N-acetyltransferase
MAIPSSSVRPILDANISIEKRSSTADRVSATTPWESQIRVVPPSEYKAAAQSLAEAFAEDDVVRYPIDAPDRSHWTEAERFQLHRQALEYITYAHCVKGLVTTVGDDYGCVALWMPPGKNMDDWFTILRSGMWRLKFQLSSKGKERFFKEFLPLLHTTKEEVMGERDADCWYLVYLGTKLASRGKGYARKLVEHITERVSILYALIECYSARLADMGYIQADHERRACYLESSNDINPIIYGKMGFKVVRNVYLKGETEDIRMDIMVREPRHILCGKGK